MLFLINNLHLFIQINKLRIKYNEIRLKIYKNAFNFNLLLFFILF